MTFSPSATLMITAQGLCGAAGAALVPSLVALIAENYHGTQQATAVGALGSARAGAGVAAFLIGGILGTHIGWRPAFGLLIALSVIVLLLSLRLKPDKARPEVQIDIVGVFPRSFLLVFGFNNLNRWGLGLASPGAPLNLLGLSPAPIMIVVGIVLGQAFVMWTRKRQQEARRRSLRWKSSTPLKSVRPYTPCFALWHWRRRSISRSRCTSNCSGTFAARYRNRHDAI